MNTIKSIKLNNQFTVNGSISTSEKGSNVNASIVASGNNLGIGQRWNWTMKLQRKTKGKWKTIGTRTGYVMKGSPSHRTFTNVKKNKSKMRVSIKFTPFFLAMDSVTYKKYWRQGAKVFTRNSKTWVR